MTIIKISQIIINLSLFLAFVKKTKKKKKIAYKILFFKKKTNKICLNPLGQQRLIQTKLCFYAHLSKTCNQHSLGEEKHMPKLKHHFPNSFQFFFNMPSLCTINSKITLNLSVSILK